MLSRGGTPWHLAVLLHGGQTTKVTFLENTYFLQVRQGQPFTSEALMRTATAAVEGHRFHSAHPQRRSLVRVPCQFWEPPPPLNCSWSRAEREFREGHGLRNPVKERAEVVRALCRRLWRLLWLLRLLRRLRRHLPPNKLALAGDLAADMCRHIMVEQLAELAPLRRSLLLHPKRFDFGIKKSLPLAVGVFNGREDPCPLSGRPRFVLSALVSGAGRAAALPAETGVGAALAAAPTSPPSTVPAVGASAFAFPLQHGVRNLLSGEQHTRLMRFVRAQRRCMRGRIRSSHRGVAAHVFRMHSPARATDARVYPSTTAPWPPVRSRMTRCKVEYGRGRFAFPSRSANRPTRHAVILLS